MIGSQRDVHSYESYAGRAGFEPAGPPQDRRLEPDSGAAQLFDVLSDLEILNHSADPFPDWLVVEVTVRNPNCTHLKLNEGNETKLQLLHFLVP